MRGATVLSSQAVPVVMPQRQQKIVEWDRARITRVLHRALLPAVGDAWELTLAVALFAIEEEDIPEQGRPLWDFVEAVSDAVAKQTNRRSAELVRQRLARELRPALSRPESEQPRAEPPRVRSGMRAKVRTGAQDEGQDEGQAGSPPVEPHSLQGDDETAVRLRDERITRPVPRPLEAFRSPTIPAMPRLEGLGDQEADECDDPDEGDQDPRVG